MIRKISIAALMASFLVFFSTTLFSQQRPLYEFLGSDDRNTIIVQDFDEEEAGSKDITWTAGASRYITKTDEKPYPQIGFINAYSNTLSREFLKEDKATMRVLAVRAAFNQKGYNFVELIPRENTDNPRETDKEGNQLPGIYFESPVLKLGAYVWGSSRRYTVEAEFVTASGESFSVYMGSINYNGWRVVSGNVPIHYYNTQDLSSTANTYVVKLNKIVVWTAPTEKVNDFIVYFDNLFITTTVERLYFDGDELGDEEVINSIDWTTSNEGSNDGQAAPANGQ